MIVSWGKRVDHSLANLHLLTNCPLKVSIETERESVYAINGFHKQFSLPGQGLSFFSIGEKVKGVTTRGLKWNLHKEDLDSRFYCLSNVALEDEFEISIGSGTLILVIQNV